MSRVTLDRLFHAAVAERGDAPFLSWTGGTATYTEMDAAVQRQADAFVRDGVAGRRLALMTPNRPELLTVWLAALRTETTVAFLNAALTAEEIGAILDDLEVSTVIAGPETSAAGISWASVLPTQHGLAAGETRRREDRTTAPAIGDVSAIVLTSGSTGRPKYVPVPDRAYVSKGVMNVAQLDLGPAMKSFCTMPLFHVGAQCETLATVIAARGALHLAGPFSASRFWDDVRASGATHLHATSSLLVMALARVTAPMSDVPLELIVASLRDDVARSLSELLPRVDVVTLWGMSECPLGTLGQRADRYRAGWVGLPYDPGGIRIVDQAGEPVSEGRDGEIQIRNDTCASAYVGRASAELWTEDGWMKTRDVGHLGDGGLYLTGRLKEMIRRNGENIAPTEIEDVLVRHRCIGEAAVIAHPDPVREEEVRAFVVPADDAQLDPAEVREFTIQHLASYKVPRYVDIVDELPHTASNKVDKVTLRSTHPAPSWDAEADRVAGR